MQALGNDFVVVEGSTMPRGLVPTLCARRTGIGADGVLTIDERLRMGYWNADGSEAEMCGNGLRCLARYAVDRGWAPAGSWFSIETPVGPRRVIVGDEVTAEIGPVQQGPPVRLHERTFVTASIGNPHAVTVVDDPEAVDVAAVGRRVGTDPHFPGGTNVEFVAADGPGRIRLRVWERGVGETSACGTGMVVAAAVAGAADGVTRVRVRGGSADVTFEDGSGYLTGPATTVFVGEWAGPADGVSAGVGGR